MLGVAIDCILNQYWLDWLFILL